jgi:hypothetical protein
VLSLFLSQPISIFSSTSRSQTPSWLIFSVGAGTGELGQWWRRGARSPPAKGGDWSENGGKVLSEIGELGRRRKMENGKAGTAAGNRPKNLGGKWRRYRCWGIAGNGEGDFREGENVEGENVGGNVFWCCEYWLSNLGGNVLPRWKETDVRRKRVSRLAFPFFF